MWNFCEWSSLSKDFLWIFRMGGVILRKNGEQGEPTKDN